VTDAHAGQGGGNLGKKWNSILKLSALWSLRNGAMRLQGGTTASGNTEHQADTSHGKEKLSRSKRWERGLKDPLVVPGVGAHTCPKKVYQGAQIESTR